MARKKKENKKIEEKEENDLEITLNERIDLRAEDWSEQRILNVYIILSDDESNDENSTPAMDNVTDEWYKRSTPQRTRMYRSDR